MFKMSFFAGLFLCMLFFVGCVSSASAPEWVTNPDEVLDSKVHLWAVGSGADRKAAESDALSLLVRSIQQQVVATSDASKEMSGSHEAGFQSSYNYSSSVATVSSIKEVPGVSFSQSWMAKNGTVYLLATLNRDEAGGFYRQKIADLSAVVASEIHFATANEGTWAALTALENAVAKAWENQGYIDVLAGVHPAMYRTVSLDYVSAPAVETLAERHRDKIQVAVAVEGDSNGRVASILQSTLAEIGLKSAADGGSNGYVLQGTVSMESLDNDGKYEYVRFVVDVELRELSTGKVLTSYSKNGREAHLTKKEAEQRAYRTIEDALKKELAPQLKNFVVKN